MPWEAVSLNIQAFTPTLRGKYLEIHSYGALIPAERSTISTTAIIDQKSLSVCPRGLTLTWWGCCGL